MSLERMRFNCERESGCGECVMCALRSVDDPDLPVPYVLTDLALETLDRCDCEPCMRTSVRCTATARGD